MGRNKEGVAGMNTKSLLIALGSVFGVFILVGLMLWRFGSQPATVDLSLVQGEMRHVRGEGEHVLVEFSDFQCPACRATQPLLEQMMEQYKGKFRLVFRHFPLTNIHPNALNAAWASEAASKQGKFWEYHDLLFERQDEWANAESIDVFLGYAEQLGLDRGRFESDMQSDEVKALVAKDSGDALRLRLSATPSFFLDGEKVGAQEIPSRLGSF